MTRTFPVRLIAQLVDHCLTGISEVMGSNPMFKLEFYFQAFIFSFTKICLAKTESNKHLTLFY